MLIAVLGLEVFAGLFGHNSALITIIARDVLDTGPQGLGSLISALSAGALCGMLSMVLFHIEQRGRVILIAGAIYSLLLMSFGFSGSLGLSLAILFALGTADGMWGVARNTVVQLAAPDEIRGRAMSVVFLVTRGSTPLGHRYCGPLASLTGGPGTVLLDGLLVGAGVVSAGLRVPALGSYGRTEKNFSGVAKSD